MARDPASLEPEGGARSAAALLDLSEFAVTVNGVPVTVAGTVVTASE